MCERDRSNVATFWLVGIPLVYLATAVFYLWRGRRRGVSTSPRVYVLTGLGALIVVGPFSWQLFANALVFRGLAALLVMAIGFIVLAWAERSAALAAFALAFLGLALVANLYNMENLFGSTATQVNNIAVGGVLVIAGVGFGLGGQWRAPRPRRASA